MKVLIFKKGTYHNGVKINEVSFYDNREYPLMIDFNRRRIIGSAELSRDENGDIWAELYVEAPIKDMWEFHKVKLYPALGGNMDGASILCPCVVSICTNPNTDPNIPSFTLE